MKKRGVLLCAALAVLALAAALFAGCSGASAPASTPASGLQYGVRYEQETNGAEYYYVFEEDGTGLRANGSDENPIRWEYLDAERQTVAVFVLYETSFDTLTFTVSRPLLRTEDLGSGVTYYINADYKEEHSEVFG